jgi:hypothetical protein
MDPPPLPLWALACLAALAVALAFGASRRRRGVVDVSRERVRRGTGHAMLGLQEFIEPSVEYVFQSENLEHSEVDDIETDGDGLASVRQDLSTCLGHTPIDPEEVRRLLTRASRAGLDWRELYEEAVHSELASRPFRAPSIPPVWRVAPRG